MRCQKVRSYLSAYCNDELDGRKKLAIDEHLSDCALCRKEESLYLAMFTAKDEIGTIKVSNDFNNNLLNRIAHERFAETRTKAYHPQKPPLLVWSKVIPATVSAFVVVFTVFTLLYNNGTFSDRDNFANLGNARDNSYLTVQPTNNPNMNKSWSLDNHLAQVERSNRISRSMMPTNNFNSQQNMSLTSVSSPSVAVPYVTTYHQVRPVIRLYIVPQNDSIKESHREY